MLRKLLWLLVAWVPFAFLTFQFCIKPECCGAGGEDTTQTTPAPAPVTNDYAIVSKLGDGAVLDGTLWPDQRAKLIADYQANPDQLLEIYGHYYEGEPAPEGFENMGFYRADRIKQLLIPDIPAEQISLLSRRLDSARPAADDLWNAGTLLLKDPPSGEPVPEIIELDSDEIIIRFPFDSDEKDTDPAVDAYLNKLAQRLQQTQEKVTITGHTDNVDTQEYNLRLGQRRADFVKRILVSYGAPADRITTRSEGKSNPMDTNSTPAGRHNNRRAVVKLTPQ